mgnify:CR=1 FL=1
MPTRSERFTLDQLKAKFRREMAEFKLNVGALFEIFCMAFRAKISEPSNRHNSLGKHYFTKHPQHGPNPAGTKLVRSFIRHSNRESVYWRKLYAQMTGRQYNGVES